MSEKGVSFMNVHHPALPHGAKRNGFTLIELLVVVAIIALLAAILFPVFGSVRDKARQTSCLSNTKQIAIGLHMYIQDYDELLPVWSFVNPAGTTSYSWEWALFPYIKSRQVYVCPSATHMNSSTDARCDPTYANITGGNTSLGGTGSYGYNYSYLGRYQVVSGVYSLAPGFPLNLSAIPDPDDTVAIGEVTCQVGNQPGSIYLPEDWTTVLTGNPCGSTYTEGDQQASWHAGGCNFAFCDGHAKWESRQTIEYYKGDTLADPYWFSLIKPTWLSQ